MNRTPEFKAAQKLDKDLRSERTKNLLNFIDRTNLYEDTNKIFNENSQEEIDFEYFKKLLLRLNGLAREIPTSERHFDGDGVFINGSIGGFVPVDFKYKEDLLKYAFESAKFLSRKEASYMLPVLVNTIHYFADGNGRTTRLLHTLLSEHENKDEFMDLAEKRLSGDSIDSLDIKPMPKIQVTLEAEILKQHGWETNPESRAAYNVRPPKNYKFISDVSDFFDNYRTITPESGHISPNNPNVDLYNKFLEKMQRGDGKFLSVAFCKIFSQTSLEKMSEGADFVRITKLVESATREQLQATLDYYDLLKIQYTKSLVDMFTEPEKFKSYTKPGVLLKDELIDEIHDAYDR